MWVNLLLVEDERMVRQGLLSLDWQSLGIGTVFSAEDGMEAMAVFDAHPIDIVVTDIRMPAMDGLQLAAWIATKPRHTKVLLLTGFGEFHYAKQAIASGVFDYLLKPIDPDLLLQTVARAKTALVKLQHTDRLIARYEQTKKPLTTTHQTVAEFEGVSPTVFSLLVYLSEHYHEELSLAHLAHHFHFSSVHLSRSIKKETGFSYSDLVLAMRLLHATRLLKESDLKVHTLCERVGFSDQRYFSQVFRRIFGCTPSAYRQDTTDPVTLRSLLDRLRQTRAEEA